MIPRYLATLAGTVCIVTLAASSLEFATRSQVAGGKAVDENLQFEFTIDADSRHTYEINPGIKRFLENNISFYTEGPAHVVSAKVAVTPKEVSWTESRTTITSQGAAIAAQLQWDTPAASANGAHSYIYLHFPEIPGLAGKTLSFHSGGYEKDDNGRYVIREVTTYKNSFLLSFARFVFALAAGVPFGILLHTILWAFVLKGERRSRIAALPTQGSGLPRTFYPDPVAEWTIWLLVLGIGSVMASMMAGLSVYDGFMSSSFSTVVYSVLAIAAAIALVAAWFSGKRLLTVRVDTSGISYARGRDDLQWVNAAWSDIRLCAQKSRTYRGSTSYWIELQFNDNRRKLKIGQSVLGYPALRDLIMSLFTAQKRS